MNKIKLKIQRIVSDKNAVYEIGSDLRKIAVTCIGVGVVGLAVSGDTITWSEAAILLIAGAVLWLYGILLTVLNDSKEA